MSASLRFARVVAATAFTAVMAFFALRSSPYLEQIPWMPRRLGSWADHHGVLRNTVGFFVFSFTVFLLINRRPVIIVALCLFGTAVEVAQIWIPGRTFDWNDIAASIGGVLLAWPFAWLIGRRLRWAV